jgi:hypothetical protein
VLSLFKGKAGAADPIPAAPKHPLQGMLMNLLSEMEAEMRRGMEQKPTKGEPRLPKPLVLSALAALPIGRTWLEGMTPEQCDKFTALLNSYNARLCHECGIEPERYQPNA